ncbi:unnamed protein product [Sympodiomycopsis kandeliae]
MLPSLATRAASSTLSRTPPLLLTPSDLQQIINTSSPRPPVILDCSWHMPNSNRNAAAEFERGPRIPGALRWDVDEVATKGAEVLNLPHMMPSSKIFAQYAESKGIDTESHVVCYDTHGIFSSPRAAFTFLAFGHQKVSLLNGGLPAWIEAEQEVEEGEYNPASRSIANAEYPPPSKLQEGWVRSFEEVHNNSKMGSRGQTVLDARPKGRYDGTAPEPRARMSSGHVPNSLSLPFNSILLSHESTKPLTQRLAPKYTTLPDQVELYRRLRTMPTNTLNQNHTTQSGDAWSASPAEGEKQPLLDFEKLRQSSSNSEPSITMSCGSGMTAAVLWLAFKTLGIQGSIYDESWMGWATRANDGQAEIEKSQIQE